MDSGRMTAGLFANLTPGRLRWLSLGSAALSTAMRMVAGIHCHSAHRWPNPQVAHPSRLSDDSQVPGGVGDDADGGPTGHAHLADLPRGQLDGTVETIGILSHQGRLAACRATQLATPSGSQLNVVDGRAESNVRQTMGRAGELECAVIDVTGTLHSALDEVPRFDSVPGQPIAAPTGSCLLHEDNLC